MNFEVLTANAKELVGIRREEGGGSKQWPHKRCNVATAKRKAKVIVENQKLEIARRWAEKNKMVKGDSKRKHKKVRERGSEAEDTGTIDVERLPVMITNATRIPS